MFFTNKPLLVLDGHGKHVTLKEIKHAQEFGFDMITSPSHTSHVLQPLNMSYFEPFKITLKNVRDAIMFRINHIESNNITFANWVN